VGISKDIIVTAGHDKYIRVFEYPGSQHVIDNLASNINSQQPLVSPNATNLNQLSSSKSKEPPLCIAMHPMGL
jgi:hypothetical protein